LQIPAQDAILAEYDQPKKLDLGLVDGETYNTLDGKFFASAI
jgi:hypothetical protein